MVPQSRMLAVEHPEYIIIGFLQYNLHWTTLKSPLRQKKRWLKTWFKSQKSNAIFRWVFVTWPVEFYPSIFKIWDKDLDFQIRFEFWHWGPRSIGDAWKITQPPNEGLFDNKWTRSFHEKFTWFIGIGHMKYDCNAWIIRW